MNQLNLFAAESPKPKPQPTDDPSMSRREPPQVAARRDGLRVAEPLQHDLRGKICGALASHREGMTRLELLTYINRRWPDNSAGESSLCAPLKQLEDSGAIATLPERRMGTKGVKVTVYVHAMHAKGAV